MVNARPSEAARVEPLLTGPFVCLMVAHFLQALGYSSMLLLPLCLQHLEASRTEIGAIMATAAASGLLARPFVGWSLDRFGRKPTLVVGTAIMVVALAMVGLVDRIGPLVYAERAVFGVGVGVLFTAYFTYAADSGWPISSHRPWAATCWPPGSPAKPRA